MPRAKKKNKGGRPSSYKPEFNRQARNLCLLGATDAELADSFGVTERTINAWKKEHPKFLQSLKAGKEEADSQVAKSLYRRALGYTHKAVKILTVSVGNNGGSEVQEVPYIERYPPDTTAGIFWLKNRRPDVWRDRQNVDLTSNGESLAVLMRAAEQRLLAPPAEEPPPFPLIEPSPEQRQFPA